MLRIKDFIESVNAGRKNDKAPRLQIVRRLFLNKGWMYLFCDAIFTFKKIYDVKISQLSASIVDVCFLSSRRRSTREATVLENKGTCHNSCHNLLSISIEINFCTHNSQAPNQAIPFYHLDVSERRKNILLHFSSFQQTKSKLHRILFFVLAEGWKIFS